MTLKKAMEKIERYCSKEGANGDPSCPLWLDSQLELDYETGKYKPRYRADIGYMWCGYFEDTIELALISLAKELERIGE